MSSGELSSAGLWLMPPFRLRTKSIPDGTPALARMPASWPAPGRQLEHRHAEALQLRAERGADLLGHHRRLGADRRLDVERCDQAVEPLGCRGRGRPPSGRRSRGRRSCRPARPRAARPSRPRRRLPLATSRAWSTNSAAATSASSRPSIGVVPACPGVTREAPPAADVADDRGHDAERGVRAEEHGALLDVQLDVGVGQDAARHARAAPGAAPLLVPEDDDAETGLPSASTASSPATTPSAPSKRPAPGTVSRCEPVQTWRSPPGIRPIRFPAASTSTSSPASRNHLRASSCAASSSGSSRSGRRSRRARRVARGSSRGASPDSRPETSAARASPAIGNNAASP